MNFTAFDFETANNERTSACSIGITVVEEGRVTLSREWLIKPEPFYFSYGNIQIHGITPDRVENEPEFYDVWQEIEQYFQGDCVAHNIGFDKTVLSKCLAIYGLFLPHDNFFCSVKASRRHWPQFQNHKLNTVADELGIELKHHDAASDANACAEIILKIAEEKEVNSLTDIYTKIKTPKKN